MVQQKDCITATYNQENCSANLWWPSDGMDGDQLLMLSRGFCKLWYDPFKMLMMVSATLLHILHSILGKYLPILNYSNEGGGTTYLLRYTKFWWRRSNLNRCDLLTWECCFTYYGRSTYLLLNYSNEGGGTTYYVCCSSTNTLNTLPTYWSWLCYICYQRTDYSTKPTTINLGYIGSKYLHRCDVGLLLVQRD